MMDELDTAETSAVGAETAGTSETAEVPEHTLPRQEEVEALKAIYPSFDVEAELAHPVMGAFLRGEASPTLRQLYEAVHWEEIAAARAEAAISAAVETAVAEAVATAVASAVKESEERLLGHIRARGRRPSENGVSVMGGARLSPAVERLTRRERAMLAKRAENGEHIRF